MSKRAILEAKALAMAFGDQALFADVSLSLYPNEILGLVGPSGAGKTSIGNLLCGLLKPQEGLILLDGCQLHDLAARDLPIMCWQNASLFDHLDVVGNIALGLTIRRVSDKQRKEVVDGLVDALGLGPLRHKNVRQLSGGERARVGLARAMAVDPKVLILDEPFASLDVISRDRAIGVVTEFIQREGKAALLISHIFADIASLCRGVMVIDGPTPRSQVDVQELMERPRSAFEAQVSGRWRIASAEICASNGAAFVCATAFGQMKMEVAPWIAAEQLTIGQSAAVIDQLRPATAQPHDLAPISFKWLIPR